MPHFALIAFLGMVAAACAAAGPQDQTGAGGDGGDPVAEGQGGAAGTGGAGAGSGGETAAGGAGAGAGAAGTNAGGSPAGGAGGAAGAGGVTGGAGGAGGVTGGAGGAIVLPPQPMTGAFGASRCAGAGFRLCDDFESGTPGQRLATTNYDVTGTIVYDATRSARGRRSIKISTPVKSRVAMYIRRIFPIQGNSFWGRMFVYETPMLDKSADVNWDWFEAGGTIPGSASRFIRAGGLSGRWNVGYLLESGGEYVRNRNALVPTQPYWRCIEWNFRGDRRANPAAGHDEFHMYVDGVEIEDVKVVDSNVWQMPNFAYLAIGHHCSQNWPAIPRLELWIDEVAIHTSRIGCDR